MRKLILLSLFFVNYSNYIMGSAQLNSKTIDLIIQKWEEVNQGQIPYIILKSEAATYLGLDKAEDLTRSDKDMISDFLMDRELLGCVNSKPQTSFLTPLMMTAMLKDFQERVPLMYCEKGVYKYLIRRTIGRNLREDEETSFVICFMRKVQKRTTENILDHFKSEKIQSMFA